MNDICDQQIVRLGGYLELYYEKLEVHVDMENVSLYIHIY